MQVVSNKSGAAAIDDVEGVGRRGGEANLSFQRSDVNQPAPPLDAQRRVEGLWLVASANDVLQQDLHLGRRVKDSSRASHENAVV